MRNTESQFSLKRLRPILTTILVVMSIIWSGCGPQASSSRESEVAPQNPRTEFSASGGSDGGGGGLAYYRMAQALVLAQKYVRIFDPKRIDRIHGDVDAHSTKSAADLSQLYSKINKHLSELLFSLKVRVVNPDEIEGYPFRIKGREILVPETDTSFVSHGGSLPGMDALVREILQTAFKKLIEQNIAAEDISFENLTNVIMEYGRLCPVGQSNLSRVSFQYGGSINLSLDEFLKVARKSYGQVPSFANRLNRAREVAVQIIERASPVFLKEQANRDMFAAQKDAYLNLLENVKIHDSWPEQPGDYSNSFPAKQAWYKNGEIKFSRNIRYAMLDELVFIMLHEVAHALPFVGPTMVMENKINSFALDLLDSVQAKSPGVMEFFEVQRTHLPIDLDEVKSRIEPVRIKITNWSKDGSRHLLLGNSASNDSTDYRKRDAKLKKFCKAYGLTLFEGSVLTRKTGKANDHRLLVYDQFGRETGVSLPQFDHFDEIVCYKNLE